MVCLDVSDPPLTRGISRRAKGTLRYMAMMWPTWQHSCCSKAGSAAACDGDVTAIAEAAGAAASALARR